MKSQILDHARRPAPLRARQKTALSATERDCFASHQKPKRFAVRGCAVPGCFARRRLPPTAIKRRSREQMPAGNRSHCEIQMCHQMKCPMSAISHKHALLLSLLRRILSRDLAAFQQNLRHVRSINRPRFSHHSAKNPPRFSQGCATRPPRFGHVRNVAVVVPHSIRFLIRVHSAISIHARSVRSACQYVQRLAPPGGDQAVCVSRVCPISKKHPAVAQSRVGRLLESSPFAAACERHPFPSLLLRCCFGLRRTCVRTFIAASCCRASWAESVGLCPLAPDGRNAIACPRLRPQAIACSVLCRFCGSVICRAFMRLFCTAIIAHQNFIAGPRSLVPRAKC